MKFTRLSRSVAVIVAIISVLYMQLAVASYACPGLNQEQMAVERVDMDDMAGCSGMDTEQPSLCYAAAQTGKQSLDKPHAPGVAPFIPTGFAALIYWSEAFNVFAPDRDGSLTLTRVTEPPLAIRNCCFRI